MDLNGCRLLVGWELGVSAGAGGIAIATNLAFQFDFLFIL